MVGRSGSCLYHGSDGMVEGCDASGKEEESDTLTRAMR